MAAKAVLADRFAGARLNSPNDVDERLAGAGYGSPTRATARLSRGHANSTTVGLSPRAAIRRREEVGDPPGNLRYRPARMASSSRPTSGPSTWHRSRPKDQERGSVNSGPIRSATTIRSGGAPVLHDFGEARGIDGMCWDTEGNIVAACGWELSGPGPRVAVFAPDGTALEEHAGPGGSPNELHLWWRGPQRPLRDDDQRAPLPRAEHRPAGRAATAARAAVSAV